MSFGALFSSLKISLETNYFYLLDKGLLSKSLQTMHFSINIPYILYIYMPPYQKVWILYMSTHSLSYKEGINIQNW